MKLHFINMYCGCINHFFAQTPHLRWY